MRIGILSKYSPAEDGIAIYTENLIGQLINDGVKVIKIGQKDSESDYQVDFSSFKLRKELAQIIEKEKLHALHIQHIAPYFSKKTLNLNMIFALKQKVPVIVTFHEVYYKKNSIKSFLLNMIEYFVVKSATKVIVHTDIQRKYLEKSFKTNNIETVYMGIKSKKLHLRKHKNLLFFGLISQNKGVHILLNAMDKLRDFNLTVAGKLGDNIKKSYLDELIAIKKELKLDNVQLEFGWVQEKRKTELFEEADLMIMPYLWAPYQSAALHDAFSYGLPVVVTDAGAVHEVVEQFGSGIVVKANDAMNLSEGIRTAIKSYDQLQSGIIDYRKEADWKSVSHKTIEVYNSALNK